MLKNKSVYNEKEEIFARNKTLIYVAEYIKTFFRLLTYKLSEISLNLIDFRSTGLTVYSLALD